MFNDIHPDPGIGGPDHSLLHFFSRVLVNRGWLFAAPLLFLPVPLFAQEAHSMAIGGAATSAPMEIYGFFWNPAILAVPGTANTTWAVATGGSFFDTSNTGSAIFRFNPDNAAQSAQDPVNRYQQYLGTFAVKYANAVGGFVFDQELNSTESQGALAFFNSRDNGAIPAGKSYNLDFEETRQQIGDVILSYGSPLPIGNFPFLAVGGSLKYHDGIQYQRTLLTGVYTQGSSTGYQYTRTTSTSGLGLSLDGGFLVKINDSLSAAMMFQNLQSNFTWQAKQQTFTLDPTTGAETSTASSDVDINANFPYATKLGLSACPPDKNIALEGEVAWTQGVTNWRAGLERWYPENNLVVRMGTFNDRVSNSQLWTFGVGYQIPVFNIDAAFVTRSLPAVQDSISFGAALDAEVRF